MQGSPGSRETEHRLWALIWGAPQTTLIYIVAFPGWLILLQGSWGGVRGGPAPPRAGECSKAPGGTLISNWLRSDCCQARLSLGCPLNQQELSGLIAHWPRAWGVAGRGGLQLCIPPGLPAWSCCPCCPAHTRRPVCHQNTPPRPNTGLPPPPSSFRSCGCRTVPSCAD